MWKRWFCWGRWWFGLVGGVKRRIWLKSSYCLKMCVEWFILFIFILCIELLGLLVRQLLLGWSEVFRQGRIWQLVCRLRVKVVCVGMQLWGWSFSLVFVCFLVYFCWGFFQVVGFVQVLVFLLVFVVGQSFEKFCLWKKVIRMLEREGQRRNLFWRKQGIQRIFDSKLRVLVQYFQRCQEMGYLQSKSMVLCK